MALFDLIQKKNRNGGGGVSAQRYRLNVPEGSLQAEDAFRQALSVEKRRTERSGKPFILMLLDLRDFERNRTVKREVVEKVMQYLFTTTRETDIKGWYKSDAVIGTIFTEVNEADGNVGAAQAELHKKLQKNLNRTLEADQSSRILVTWHAYPGFSTQPGRNEHDQGEGLSDLWVGTPRKRGALFIKRIVDIVGSLFVMILLAPALAILAALVKVTSRGPVFFKQERIGLGGKRFMFLKFRSMHVNCDSRIHKEYIREFICDNNGSEVDKDGVFKITRDSRVTRIGGPLRKLSLDELPQFINVLKGEMSLVGPRPPIPYECADNDTWHMRRVLDMKPGITGLWQVKGRSRTTFDDMVRMDINYILSWSLWLDISILLKTPFAVLAGKGAY